MKCLNFATVIIVALLCVCTTDLSAQKLSVAQVPKVVRDGFIKQFPNAKRPQWELETVNCYEVNFRQMKLDYSAKFDLNGNLLETESEMEIAELPPSILQVLKTQFAGFKIKEAEKVLFADGTTAYELTLKKGKQVFEVQFNAEGLVLKQEAAKGD